MFYGGLVLSDVLVKYYNWIPQFELIHLMGLIPRSMLAVQKDKEFRTTEPLSAAYCVLQSVPLHTKLSCLAHLLKVKEAVCSRLSCTGQWPGTNNKDFFWSGLDGAFSGSSKAWSTKTGSSLFYTQTHTEHCLRPWSVYSHQNRYKGRRMQECDVRCECMCKQFALKASC